MRLLGGGNRVIQRQLALHVLHRLAVAERIERTHRTVSPQERLGFFNQAVLEHLRGTKVDALVQSFSVGKQSQAKQAKAAQRITSLLPKSGHGLARSQTYFQGAHHFGNIIGVNGPGRRRIKTAQHLMQVTGPALRGALSQALTPVFGPWRSGQKALKQGAEIKASAPNDDRQVMASADLVNGPARQAGVGSGCELVRRTDNGNQAVRNAPALFRSWFGQGNVALPVDRNRDATVMLSLQ